MSRRNEKFVPRLTLEVNSAENSNIIDYAATNISSDHDFTKLLTPSHQPSFSPSLIPSYQPSFSPSFTPSTTPTTTPTTIPTSIACPGFLNENNEENENNSSNDIIANGFPPYEITYDYEIVTSTETKEVASALVMLERQILDDMARFLECEGRKKLQISSGKILSIDSLPLDKVDERNACGMDAEFSVGGDVKCTPIIGAMTFYSDCSTCPYPEDEILTSIKQGFESNRYVDGDLIKQVNYIGNRNVIPLKSTTGPNQAVVLGSSFGVVAAVSAAICALLFFRVRSRQRDKSLPLSSADDIKSDKMLDQSDMSSEEEEKTVNLSYSFVENEEEEGIDISPISNISSIFSHYSMSSSSDARLE